MKTGLCVRAGRAPLAALVCVFLAGCMARSPADVPGMSPEESHGQASDDACPSQDFNIFLQRYAAATDDVVRRRYTDDPLEYEVPTHTVEDETASSPPTHVSARNGDDRLLLFPYRYSRDAGAFARVLPGTDGDVGNQPPYPVVITNEPAGGRKVAFGMEYEIDTYMFRRSDDCWHLARAINLRD
jgi:hypothetical protein